MHNLATRERLIVVMKVQKNIWGRRWCNSISKIPSLPARLLASVHNNAFREDRVIAALRQERDHTWWLMSKMETKRQRSELHAVQNRQEYKRKFEDIFVEFYGTSWRCIKAECDRNQWRQSRRDFIEFALSKWKLDGKPSAEPLIIAQRCKEELSLIHI